MPTSVKITSKGQVTIPEGIRNLLGSDLVEFEIINGSIVVKPVKSVAGSLSDYAPKYIPIKDIRDKVWVQVAHDRTGKKNP